MKKTMLIILTESFPYGQGEQFLDAEMPYYSKFDEVLVAASIVSGVSRISLQYRAVGAGGKINVTDVLKVLPFVLCDRDVWSELLHHGRHIKNILNALRMALYGTRLFLTVKNNVVWDCQTRYVIYSYWLMNTAFAAKSLGKLCTRRGLSVSVVSRCHGYDVYSSRHPFGYIPFRRAILSSLSRVYPVSNSGRQELLEQNSKYIDAKYVQTQYLGTENSRNPIDRVARKTFVIVSCSSLIPLKRVDRIIDALSMIDDMRIDWHHLGGGELQPLLEEYANAVLPSNVRAKFYGQIPHDRVVQYYYDIKPTVFINVSSTEGVPVSIMEALSCGIPVIATDVGGVNEAVSNEKNGFLLLQNYQDIELVSLIKDIALCSDTDYQHMRKVARESWELGFTAKRNYSEYSRKLLSLGVGISG